MMERYGKSRMKRGLLHFILGKGISSVAGFFAMVLVVRALSIESFAAYSVLTGLVDLLTALSGLGFAHVLLRYVPELYAQHYRMALSSLISNAVTLRTGVLLLMALFAWFFADNLTPFIGLASQLAAFKAFLLVVVLRSSTHFLSQVLESTLHQGMAQFAFSCAAITRLLGMAYLLTNGHVTLMDVISIEVIGDTISLFVVVFCVLVVLKKNAVVSGSPENDHSWIKENFRHLARFALMGGGQHLALLPYGGNTNRLIGGRMLDFAALANYGFAQSMYEYIKRYLPAQLLVGLIRPIVIARYCERRDFSVAASLCSQVLKINILLLGAILAMVIAGGSEAFSWLSAGKYGVDAAVLFAILIVVLIFETQRQQLDLLIQTVGKYKELIPSNILLSSSVILAVLILPVIGAIAFPLANLLGLIVANCWVMHRMKLMGYRFNFDWFALLIVGVLLIVSVVAGLFVKYAGGPWICAVVTSAFIYVGLGWVGFENMLRDFMRELTPNSQFRFPELAPQSADVSPKIAFGVLSSKHSADAVDQIASLVFPHPVYVHHDFSKQPEFSPSAKNVYVLRDPLSTSWGNWSLVAASYRLMEAALEDSSVTHFQLLSESCLPIRSIGEFEKYLKNNQPDLMIDILRIKDSEAVYSHGWRYMTIEPIHRRIFRKATVLLFGKSKIYQMVCSVNLHRVGNGGCEPPTIVQKIGKWIIDIYADKFDKKLAQFGLKEIAIGGQWFGASRRAMLWLLAARSENVEFTKYYEQCHIPDESYIHTLVLNAQIVNLPLRVFSSNHVMTWNLNGNGPDELNEAELRELICCGKYFARKFPLDGFCNVRQCVVNAIG